MIKQLYFDLPKSVLQCQEQIYHFKSEALFVSLVIILVCVSAGLLAGPSYSPSASLARGTRSH